MVIIIIIKLLLLHEAGFHSLLCLVWTDLRVTTISKFTLIFYSVGFVLKQIFSLFTTTFISECRHRQVAAILNESPKWKECVASKRGSLILFVLALNAHNYQHMPLIHAPLRPSYI